MPPVAVADDCRPNNGHSAKDLAGNWRSLGLFWVLPSLVMAAASFIDPKARGVIWTIMLLWMGGACLVNARRCTRTHCRFTGPFLILMAGLVASYAIGLLVLGAHGWAILGAATLIGFVFLWWGSEQIWGMFWRC